MRLSTGSEPWKSTMMTLTALLTAAGCDIARLAAPRAERIAELKEQIKDISHNGEEGE
jgi:hypothetical protein